MNHQYLDPEVPSVVDFFWNYLGDNSPTSVGVVKTTHEAMIVEISEYPGGQFQVNHVKLQGCT